MPTIATSRLPAPTGWDEFEDICKSAFSLRWANTALARHGRQGQKQNGVDIYGMNAVHKMLGVQCKNTVAGITEQLIESECTNAESFHPPLSELHIATTADRDANIQMFARTLSEERLKKGLFPVHLSFWPDIVSDLGRDESVARQHYPQFFPLDPLDPRQIARTKDVERIGETCQKIHFSFISSELQCGAKYIHCAIIDDFENLNESINSPTFHINDEEL